MGNKRIKLLEATGDLIECQGYHATGLNQIIKESGAPKGSLYHHFPGGKEDLVAHAVNEIHQTMVTRSTAKLAELEDAGDAIAGLVLQIAHYGEQSNWMKGPPLTAVTLETATTSDLINEACQNAYHALEEVIANRLRQSNLLEEDVLTLATLTVSLLEGSSILARTYHDARPMHVAAEHLRILIQAKQR